MKNKGKHDPTKACFLTTATVDSMGLPDDCEPLQLARFLRDEKMQTERELSAVELYYKVAPVIVSRTEGSEWNAFWRNHMRKITTLIKLGEYDLAKDLYTYATAQLINKKVTNYSDSDIVDSVYQHGLHGVGQKWLPYFMRFGILKASLAVGLAFQSARLRFAKMKFSRVLDH